MKWKSFAGAFCQSIVPKTARQLLGGGARSGGHLGDPVSGQLSPARTQAGRAVRGSWEQAHILPLLFPMQGNFAAANVRDGNCRRERNPGSGGDVFQC